MSEKELQHYGGTYKTKYVETRSNSSPKTYTNNLWLAVLDMHASLVGQGVPFEEIEKFMREEMSLDLKLAKEFCLEVWKEESK